MAFVFMGGCADKLVLFPSTDKLDAAGAARKAIPWKHGAVEIWAARSPGARSREPEALVLNFVGNAARAELQATYDAMQWRDKPVEVWTVNHPGYGGSTGPASLQRFPGAGVAAYDALEAEARGRPIFLMGQSIGTTVALHVATQRKADGLILQNPPPLRQLILGRFGWWNLWLIAGPVAAGIPSELDSIRNARNSSMPAIFISADKDEVVPPQYQQQVMEAYAGPKQVVINVGANHNSGIGVDAMRKLDDAKDWLWRAAETGRR